jgi:hypothetical protein
MMTDLKNAFGYIRELPEAVRKPYMSMCHELASITDEEREK